MDVAYHVTWRDPDGAAAPARLRLEPHGVRLEQLEEAGSHDIPFGEIVGIELDPVAGAGSGLTLVLAGGAEVELATNVKRWILSDLLGALFAHRLGKRGEHGSVLVRARLRPGCGERARRLLQDGPPFEPSTTPLVLHEAFVLDDEVLFLFETDGDSGLLSLTRPDFWQAAVAWSELIAGSVRLVEPAYSWEREGRVVLAEAHPGLGL